MRGASLTLPDRAATPEPRTAIRSRGNDRVSLTSEHEDREAQGVAGGFETRVFGPGEAGASPRVAGIAWVRFDVCGERGAPGALVGAPTTNPHRQRAPASSRRSSGSRPSTHEPADDAYPPCPSTHEPADDACPPCPSTQKLAADAGDRIRAPRSSPPTQATASEHHPALRRLRFDRSLGLQSARAYRVRAAGVSLGRG
jgi:hypothetical protein